MALRIQNGSARPHASQATKINFASASGTLPASSSEPTEFSKDSGGSVSASLPRESKPLKGILMNQGFRSRDSTPNSSPRAVPDASGVAHAVAPSVSDPCSAKRSDQQPQSISQKRSMTSSAVADFLRKFSPKLTRSKKSLQWYTVDIQPSGAAAVQPDKFSSSTSRNSDFETDPTARELQNGRISSEFSSEMSECLAKNLDLKSRSLPAGVSPSSSLSSGPQSARSAVSSRTAQDKTDFLKSGSTSARGTKPVNGHSGPVFSSPVSKSMPATPVAHNHHQNCNQEWRMMMVDIDLDRTEKELAAVSRQKKMDYLGDLTAGLRNYAPQGFSSAPASVDRRGHDHVPSYIRLSRALNGYSARNMYSSKKLANSRDYNVMLCRSEEFLNRPASRNGLYLDDSLNHTNPPPLSAKELRSQPTRDDIRRAASEGRDISGFRTGRAVLVEIPTPADAPAAPAPAVVPDQVKEAAPSLDKKAGHAFLRKLDSEMEKLRELCRKGQQDLDVEREDMPEDVKDHLRSAVGKTNLLLTQKCMQFSDLCNKNINELPDDSLKTTTSDLEGFWDLLCIQISICHRMFEEVYQPKTGASGGSLDSPDTIHSARVGGAKPESRSGSRRSSDANSAAAAGPRRSSKPKVTFQLTEKDVQRKEMIAAKRREFEQQQLLSQAPDGTGAAFTAAPEVDFFVPAASVN